MHRHYKLADSFVKAFNLCLEGLPDAAFEYLKLVGRLQPYLGLLNSPACLSVRFEKLRAEHSRHQELNRIGNYLVDCAIWEGSVDQCIDGAIKVIEPDRSHTFSRGDKGTWGDRLSRDQINRMQEQLTPVALAMGYHLS